MQDKSHNQEYHLPDLKFAYTFCIVLMKSVCLLLSV